MKILICYPEETQTSVAKYINNVNSKNFQTSDYAIYSHNEMMAEVLEVLIRI